MEFDPEANLANSDIVADCALILGLINELPFTTCTFKAAIILWHFFLARHQSCKNLWLVFRRLLLLRFTPLLCVLFQYLQPFVTPVGSTEGALHLFTTRGVVFEATRKTLSMRIATASEPTMGEILAFFHFITANAAGLTSLHWSRRYSGPRLRILFDVFHPACWPSKVCIPSQLFCRCIAASAMAFVLPEQSHRFSVLLLDARCFTLPIPKSCPIFKKLLLSRIDDFLNLCVGE
jgi:hypothetical protein